MNQHGVMDWNGILFILKILRRRGAMTHYEKAACLCLEAQLLLATASESSLVLQARIRAVVVTHGTAITLHRCSTIRNRVCVHDHLLNHNRLQWPRLLVYTHGLHRIQSCVNSFNDLSKDRVLPV